LSETLINIGEGFLFCFACNYSLIIYHLPVFISFYQVIIVKESSADQFSSRKLDNPFKRYISNIQGDIDNE